MISGYKYKFIGSNKHNVNNFLLNSNTIKEIKKKRFDANIIFGWNNLYYFKVYFIVFYSKKLILRAENNLLKKENDFKKFLKKFFFFYFFKFFDYFLYIGKQNYEFYRKNGVPKKN